MIINNILEFQIITLIIKLKGSSGIQFLNIMQIINSIICAIKGHHYPIKWTRDKMPNGEIVESGMADLYQPCSRCGKMQSDKHLYDIEKMFWNICEELKDIKRTLQK